MEYGSRTRVVPDHVSKGRKQPSIPINSNLHRIIKESEILDNPSHYYLFSKKLRSEVRLVTPRRADERHSQALKDCGLYDGKLTLYSWKHTGAQNAFREGSLDIMDLKEMLRHHALDMTYVYLKALGLNINKRINDKEW